jgi:hypothetical protein
MTRLISPQSAQNQRANRDKKCTLSPRCFHPSLPAPRNEKGHALSRVPFLH